MPATVAMLNTALNSGISGVVGSHGTICAALWYGNNEVSSGGYMRLPISGFDPSAAAIKNASHRVSWTPSTNIFYDQIFLIGTGASTTLHYINVGSIQQIAAGNTAQILISFSGTGV